MARTTTTTTKIVMEEQQQQQIYTTTNSWHLSRLTSTPIIPLKQQQQQHIYKNKHLRPHVSPWCYLLMVVFLTLCCLLNMPAATNAFVVSYDVHREAMNWDHAVDLNEDFRVLWTISDQSVTFELQVRAMGYVGFGFSKDGNQTAADMAIGWVDRGHTFFQDRHVDDYIEGTLFVDPSQDYMLIMGYENLTHTVLRFRRKLDTCDNLHDVIITNNTMQIMYMYSDEDPPHAGSVHAGALPNIKDAWRTPRSLILTQQMESDAPTTTEHARTLEFRNSAVDLPYGDDTLLWCQMFKIDNMPRKQHLVRVSVVFAK